MIAVQILLIAAVALLADADECSCRCNEQDVCEEQNKLKMEQDTHADEIQKWNKHYNFMSQLNRTWQKQVTHVVKQQLEVGMDESLEECLKNVSQKEVCKQKENLIPRIHSPSIHSPEQVDSSPMMEVEIQPNEESEASVNTQPDVPGLPQPEESIVDVSSMDPATDVQGAVPDVVNTDPVTDVPNSGAPSEIDTDAPAYKLRPRKGTIKYN